jgi:hypothetical protein
MWLAWLGLWCYLARFAGGQIGWGEERERRTALTPRLHRGRRRAQRRAKRGHRDSSAWRILCLWIRKSKREPRLRRAGLAALGMTD